MCSVRLTFSSLPLSSPLPNRPTPTGAAHGAPPPFTARQLPVIDSRGTLLPALGARALRTRAHSGQRALKAGRAAVARRLVSSPLASRARVTPRAQAIVRRYSSKVLYAVSSFGARPRTRAPMLACCEGFRRARSPDARWPSRAGCFTSPPSLAPLFFPRPPLRSSSNHDVSAAERLIMARHYLGVLTCHTHTPPARALNVEDAFLTPRRARPAPAGAKANISHRSLVIVGIHL